MAECQNIEISTKSTLPAKIIYLRKISQENHVKRMKLAYQKKEMKGLRDLLSCLSPSFPRKPCRSKSSFSTPINFQSCTNDIQSRRKKSELLPARAKSDDISSKYLNYSKHNSNKKYAEVAKNSQKILSHNKNTPFSTFSKGNDYDFLNSNKNNYASDGTELKNEINISCFRNEISSSRNNKKDKGKIDEQLCEKSPIVLKVQNNADEKESNKKLLPKNKPSKIPIWKSNLKMKNNFIETKRDCRLENLNNVVEKSLKSMCIDAQNQIRELSFKRATEKEDDDDKDVEKIYGFTNYNCFEDDSYKNLYRTFCEEEESRDEISLVKKWMNSTTDTTETGKNYNESSVTSKFKNLRRISPLQEKKIPNAPRKENTLELIDVVNDSGGKYDYTTDISESEDSLDTCYEFEGTDDERKIKKIENMSKWNDVNFEAESTITVPSDKDLEVADHRDPVFRNLPDYPNTPYNLRYPRHKFKELNKNLRRNKIV